MRSASELVPEGLSFTEGVFIPEGSSFTEGVFIPAKQVFMSVAPVRVSLLNLLKA